MTPLSLPHPVLEQTLDLLRASARNRCERVALWLAPAVGPSTVSEVYEPHQETARDFFYLPPESLCALMARLKAGRLKVAAQIHTHPKEAFHSETDARWAIVRHVGALSLVLPLFAVTTTPATFLKKVKIYELSEADEWMLTPNQGSDARLVIRP